MLLTKIAIILYVYTFIYNLFTICLQLRTAMDRIAIMVQQSYRRTTFWPLKVIKRG